MIKVTAAAGVSSFYSKNSQPKTKYYNNQTSKEKVKKDFDIILDKEIKKLKINILV